jgi:hypothetical protein
MPTNNSNSPPTDGLSRQEQTEIGNELGLRGDANSANDAYLLLKVPDFGNTTWVNPDPPPSPPADPTVFPIDASQPSTTILQSFLRLGAFDYSKEPPAARELLRQIPQSNPASNPDGATASTNIVPAVSDFPTGHIFVDDVRHRATDMPAGPLVDPDHGLTQAERQAESAKLYSRGGWRDHSDGNRVSTTWGDKVEVIRGNYKMIVMGRQNDPAQSMGWEASGAHIQDYAPGTMPGASFWLEWIDDYRSNSGQQGVWLLVNTTENVYEYARNAGNFREEVWGDVNEAYVGSENPPLSSDFSATYSALTDANKATALGELAVSEPGLALKVGQGETLTAAEQAQAARAMGASSVARFDTQYATGAVKGNAGHDPPKRLPGRKYDFPKAGTTSDGRSTPPWTSDNNDVVRSNPHIIEKTWAVRIDSHTGSSSYPIPKISERTYADKMDAKTGSSSARIKDISEETWAEKVYSLTNVSGVITEHTHCHAVAAMTAVAGTIAEYTAAATVFEAATLGAHVEFELNALNHTSIELSSSIIDISLALAKMEIALVPEKLELTIPKDDKITLQDANLAIDQKITCLNINHYALKNDTLCISDDKTALTAKMTAMDVKLGV